MVERERGGNMGVVEKLKEGLQGKETTEESILSAEIEAKTDHISEVRRKAVQIRWEQVKQDREDWIRPFHDLRIEKSLEYLTDLQRIWEEGSHIINERINNQKNIRCEHCKKDVSGKRPNDMPWWVKTMYIKDEQRPGLGRSIFFCSELCANQWVHDKQQGSGAMGTDGR